jgi:hypothetical protein
MALMVDEWIWSNGGMILTGNGNGNTRGKKQSPCHYVHNEYKTDWSGIEIGPPLSEDGE